MRAGWVVVGVVLLLVGAVLVFVPLVPQPDHTVTYGRTGFTANLTGYSPTGSIAGTLSWNSNATVEFWFASCPSTDCIASSVKVQTENGTSGTISFSYPSGTEIAALIAGGPAGSTATVKLTLTEPTYGSLLILVGLALLLVGIVLRRKPSPAPVTAPPAQASSATPREASSPAPTAAAAQPPVVGSK
jgi:hypothetical protein